MTEASPPRGVLVVIVNTGMGDAVEAMPSLSLIRERWPRVRLGVACFHESQRAVLSLSGAADEVVRLPESLRYAWRAIKGFRSNVSLMRGYDRILFLYKKEKVAWPAVLAAKVAGARALYRHGYRYRDPRRNTYSDFPEHVFFQMVASSLLLGEPLTRLRELKISLPEEAAEFSECFFELNELGRKPVVFVNTQQRSCHDEWATENYQTVSQRLLEGGVDVIWNGGGDEQLKEFLEFPSTLRERMALLERPSTIQLAAVVKRCSLYLGAPNGVASIAMAVGTPTVTLVGAGEHEYPGQERIGPPWWPRGPSHRVITKVDSCQPASGGRCTCRPWGTGRRLGEDIKGVLKHLGVWKRVKKARKRLLRGIGAYNGHPPHPCMQYISVEEVLEAVRSQLPSFEGEKDNPFVRLSLQQGLPKASLVRGSKGATANNDA